MKNKSTLILLVLLVFSISVIVYQNLLNTSGSEHDQGSEESSLYTCGMHPDIIEEEPGDCPICGMKLNPIKGNTSKTSKSGKGEIIYWRAPMNPNEVYYAPGKSKMGMDLVPVYEDEGAASGIVTVDGAVMQSINVKTERVKLREISSNVFTNGVLTTDERREYAINAKVSGWVEKLYVNYTGQEVKKGQKLVDIYSPELVAAQQELLTAIAYKNALSNSSSEILNSGDELVENTIRKLELLDISEDDIKKLIETKNVTKLMTIYAPNNGTVITKNINDGEKISAGKEIVKIADLTNLWFKADIYESELGKIEIGSTAEVSFTYDPKKVYNGKISFIYPTVDPKTRTAQVRINLQNIDGKLKPAMFGNVKISGKKYGLQPTLPETAILRSGKKNLVIVALGEGRFKPVEVQLGQYSNGYYQVMNGVTEGNMIVTSSQFLIDSESSLRAAVKLFASSDAQDHENIERNKEKQSSYDASNNMSNTEYSVDDKNDKHSDHSSIVHEGVIDLKSIDKNKDGKVFQDPMDWNVISDEPGRCPLCNMKLVEVTIDEAKKNLKENGYEYKN